MGTTMRTTMMIGRRDSAHVSLLLRSMWSWDLLVALVIGLVVAVASSTIDIQPKRAWIAPVFVLSCTALAIAVRQRTNLRNRLRGSDYGEVLRIIDQTESEARMPYEITIWVAIAAVICSAPLAVAIEEICQRWAITATLTGLSIVFVWSGAALLSVLRLTALHDKNEALLESQREALKSAQRQYEAEQRQENQ